MANLFKSFLSHPLSRPALFVPVAIMIVFSIFTLTAPMDATRTAQAIHIGVVNLDEGLPMPPIKISERMLDGMSGQFPFQMEPYADAETAKSALEAGDLSLVIVFPASFSKLAYAGEQTAVQMITSQHLTVAEVQVSQQIQALLPAAMSAGVASMKLAMSQGQMPTMQMPVVAEITSLTTPGKAASLQAPFAMLYTTWLASLVGAILMTLATRARPDRGAVAATRTLFPILTTGIATLCLSLVVGATSGWSLSLPVWAVAWPSALALTWLFIGLLGVLGLWLIIVFLPLAFYQSAIGGVMSPASAAPEWLANITDWLGLDRLGSAYRGVIHGIDMPYPLALFATFAVIGVALIWLRTLLPVRKGANVPV